MIFGAEMGGASGVQGTEWRHNDPYDDVVGEANRKDELCKGKKASYNEKFFSRLFETEMQLLNAESSFFPIVILLCEMRGEIVVVEQE